MSKVAKAEKAMKAAVRANDKSAYVKALESAINPATPKAKVKASPKPKVKASAKPTHKLNSEQKRKAYQKQEDEDANSLVRILDMLRNAEGFSYILSSPKGVIHGSRGRMNSIDTIAGCESLKFDILNKLKEGGK